MVAEGTVTSTSETNLEWKINLRSSVAKKFADEVSNIISELAVSATDLDERRFREAPEDLNKWATQIKSTLKKCDKLKCAIEYLIGNIRIE